MSTSTEFAVWLITEIRDSYTQQKLQTKILIVTVDISPNSIKNPRHEPNASNDFSLPMPSTKTKMSIGLSPCLVCIDVSIVLLFDSSVAGGRRAGDRNSARVCST